MSLLLTCLAALARGVHAKDVPNIDRALDRGATALDDAAVIISNETYAFLPNIEYAHRDGDLIESTLIQTLGLMERNTVRVQDAGPEEILQAAQEAAASLGPRGTLYVYYAGHAGQHPETGERALFGPQLSLSLHSALANSLTVRELLSVLPNRGRVLVLMDAGFGPGARGGSTPYPDRQAPFLALEPPSANISVWMAASGTRAAAVIPSVRHGAFTYFLAGAIRGWADGFPEGRRDHAISVGEALAYVEEMQESYFGNSGSYVGKESSLTWTLVQSSGDRLERSPNEKKLALLIGSSGGIEEDVGESYGDQRSTTAQVGDEQPDSATSPPRESIDSLQYVYTHRGLLYADSRTRVKTQELHQIVASDPAHVGRNLVVIREHQIARAFARAGFYTFVGVPVASTVATAPLVKYFPEDSASVLGVTALAVSPALCLGVSLSIRASRHRRILEGYAWEYLSQEQE